MKFHLSGSKLYPDFDTESEIYKMISIMKFLPLSMALLGLLRSAGTQEKSSPAWNVEIPGTISDGTRAQPDPKPESIDFRVLTSRTQRLQVTEAAEMSGLPPIKGTINVTVQRVADPGTPDPPAPLPALPPNDPLVIARLKQLRESYRGTELVFLSATVFDHSRTLLRIHPNGKLEGEVTAWSNIDFSHLSGFSTYRVHNEDGTFSDYGLLMGIGNTDTYRILRRLAKYGYFYDLPEIPKLPDIAISGPSFVVVGGETQGEAMDTLSQVHDLYRKEGVRMEEVYYAREKANAERYAYLLKNPPVPEDVTLRFWKRPPSPKLSDIDAGGIR